MKHISHNRRLAFTLVEMLLVLAIMGVLLSMTVPNLLGRQQSANEDVTRGTIAGVAQAIQMYQLDHQGTLPTSREGLEALVSKVNRNDRNWRGPYIAEMPKDAWGNTLVYRFPGRKNPASYDLFSAGSDRNPGTDDDLGNWE